MHAATGISKHRHELPLDQRMYVFIGGTVVDRNRSKGVLDLRRFGSRDDALPAKHPNMGLRSRDVVRQQTLIDI